jgi:hypothetical protein
MEKLKISEIALSKRINRALKKEGLRLKKTRPGRFQHELGDYFIVDLNRSFILEKRVDLEDYGRKIGVLEAWEEMNK